MSDSLILIANDNKKTIRTLTSSEKIRPLTPKVVAHMDPRVMAIIFFIAKIEANNKNFCCDLMKESIKLNNIVAKAKTTVRQNINKVSPSLIKNILDKIISKNETEPVITTEKIKARKK